MRNLPNKKIAQNNRAICLPGYSVLFYIKEGKNLPILLDFGKVLSLTSDP